MSGTKEGGKKAAITNRLRHGKEFYSNIGREGGKKGHTGGFYNHPDRAAEAGRIGGLKSKRGPAKNAKHKK